MLRHQVPPSQMLQRRQMSLATSIRFDKTCSFRVGDWCRPNRKSGHQWRGHRVYRRMSCKSNGSDDGTSEQALPRNGSEVHSRIVVDLTVLRHVRRRGNDASRAGFRETWKSALADFQQKGCSSNITLAQKLEYSMNFFPES